MDKDCGYLVLVRHGQSIRNSFKKDKTFFDDPAALKDVRGVPDFKIWLTRNGKCQASGAGVWLRDNLGVPDEVVHSGFLRTFDTMNLALSAYTEETRRGIKVGWSFLLRERHAGYGYEMVDDEAEESFPWLQSYWKTNGDFFSQPPGGESAVQLADRTLPIVEGWRRDFAACPTKRQIVFGHGMNLHAVRFHLEGWTYEEVEEKWKSDRLRNCGMAIYRFDPEKGFLLVQVLGQPITNR